MLLKFLFFILCAFQRHDSGDFVSFSFLIFLGKRHYVDFSRTCDTSGYMVHTHRARDSEQTTWVNFDRRWGMLCSRNSHHSCRDIVLILQICFSDLLHLILIKICPD